MFVDIMSGAAMVVGFLAVGNRYLLHRRKLCACGHVRSEHAFYAADMAEPYAPESWGACQASGRVKNYRHDGVRVGWRYEPCDCQKFDALVSR